MIYKALILLNKKNPDLCFLLQKIKIEITDTIPTACIFLDKTEKKFKILIGKDFSENFTVDDYAAIIEHEILHLIFNHLNSGMFPDKIVGNVAQDAVINDISEFLKPSERIKRHKNLQSGIFLEKINQKHSVRFDVRSHTSKDIYDFLKKIKDDDLKEMIDDSFDEHYKPDINADKEAETEQELSDTIENNKDNFESLAKKMSQKSGEVKSFFDRLEKRKSDLNFSHELKKFHCQIKTDEKKATIKRPNRRTGIVFGVERKKTKKALFIVDVSGSMMDDETLKKIQASFDSCVKEKFEIDIIAGDTSLTFDQKNVAKDFDFTKIPGGGGTDLRWVGKRGQGEDCVIVVTDLEFNHSDISHLPTSKTLILCTEQKKHKTLKTIGI